LSDEITLKDIETMISILEKYLRTARRVERVLSRYSSRTKKYGYGGFDPMTLALELAKQKQQVKAIEEEEEESFELTEKEKELLEKIRKKQVKPVK